MAENSVRSQAREFKRERIIEEALKLFYEVGFQGASMEMLALRLGVTKPFIYTYFSNKHALLEALYERASDSLLASLAEVFGEPSPPQVRLPRVIAAFARNNIQNQRLSAIYLQEERNLEPPVMAKLVSREKTFDRALTALIAEGMASGVFACRDPGLASLAISGMVRWIHRWYRPAGRLSADQICEELSTLALNLVGFDARA